MRALLHLIKVPGLLLILTSLCAYAWMKTRGVTLWNQAKQRVEAEQKKEQARISYTKAAMAEMTRRKLGPPLPSIDGWSISEVESTHGPAKIKDKTTGWAVWPAFKAHFANGVVDEVEAPELR